MRFSLHGGSAEEVTALKGFAERLGAGFVAYDGLPGWEPVLTVQCFPRQLGGLVESIEQVTRRLDEAPLEEGPGVQDPLPGLETPPCR